MCHRDGWISQMVMGKFCEVWPFVQLTERLYWGHFGKHKYARDDSPQVILYKSDITYEMVSEMQNLGRDIAKLGS